jgi:hypothetical protein
MEINAANYIQDGACPASRAVLALFAPYVVDGSYASDSNSYENVVQVSRWDNCREQGYILYLRVEGKQLNIAFFEHRNSDEICAVKWEQYTANSPTLGSAKFGDIYKDKYDVSHSLKHNEHYRMSLWLKTQFEEFYEKHKRKV